jgi:peptide/nickel transport system permease protein
LKTRSGHESNIGKESLEQAPRKKLNWPLSVGLSLVIIITFLAIVGPTLAPNDPSEEHIITLIDGQWYVPPFDLGTPGYPLGSDRFGRDLYSRLLWGIRPTMILVAVVAVVRLVIGVIIGLSAGWFTGKSARFLNGLIQIALSLPILLVALGAIALVGVELGIWAFIIGLSLTGWVDTAIQVREQTRIVKGQVYVEAASAIGASNHQILSNHILKQITPMLLMLFAFELSSTLMLTAGLGFLGYYIGGDVWVETGDFVAQRISGNPELGQMLATSWVTLTKPWAMVAVGTTVFITVLGFNLIGEGLRQSMGFAKVQGRSIFADARHKIGLWFDHHVWHPLIQFLRIKPLRLGLSGIAVFFILSIGAMLILDAAAHADVKKVLANFDLTSGATPSTSLSTENSNSTEAPIGVQPIKTITYAPSIDWEFIDESGFTGGLAISQAEDRLYSVSQDGNVYSFDLDGTIIWQAQLDLGGFGNPVVDENDDILIADKSGGLTKLSPQGEVIWHFQTNVGERSHSGPAIGPDGTIYYTVGTSAKGFVQAVSPAGEHIWVSQTETPFFFETPHPSQDAKYVFIKNDIFSAQTGELIELNFDLDIRRYFSGQDGNNYLLAGHKITQWEQNDDQIEIIDVAEWDSSKSTQITTPSEVGITDDGVGWLFYTTPWGESTIVWVTLDDHVIGTPNVPISGSSLISMQPDKTAIVCGGGPHNPESTDCASLAPSSNDPNWKFHIGNFGPVVGGVIVDGRLFVTTEQGYVFAISENYDEVITSIDPETPSSITSSPSEPGIVWSYQASEEIMFGPIIGPGGMVYITTEDDNLHIINPDGEARAVVQMEASPFHQTRDVGRSAPLIIAPVVLPDGKLLVVSEENTVYAINDNGELLWEQPLEADPAQHPILDDEGNFYLLDTSAGLYSFNGDGLSWRHQSDAAKFSANGIAFGPDGNVYYVVTNYSKGFIQAVSPLGEGLWVAQTTTRDFYDELHISKDGNYLSLAENLFNTNSGEVIEFDSGGKIDEFIFGGDGRNYFRTLHKVDEWQMGQSGIEILNEGIVSENYPSLRPPLGSSADSNGIVWLYYPGRNTWRSIMVVWMSAEGDLLGSHSVEGDIHSFVAYDMSNSLLTECKGFVDTESIECKVYSPNSDEPLWGINLENIPPYNWGIIEGHHLYLMGEDNTLTAVYLGEPAINTEE